MTINNIEAIHYAISGDILTVCFSADVDADTIRQTDMSVCTIRTNTGDKVMDLDGYKYLRSLKADGETGVIVTVWGKEAIPLGELRSKKKREVGEACENTIYAGIEVAGKHYSLSEHDQIELLAQQGAVKGGAAIVPYHADGELCRIYTAEEFMPIADAANFWILYNRTRCNHINTWITRTEGEELENITYGSDLPEDLRTHMDELLAQMGFTGV